MGKLNVLQIIGSSGVGGGERVFCSLLKYLDRDKFNIFVVCPPGGPMIEDFKKYASEVRVFDLKNWFNPMTIVSLRKYMTARKIDIVHTHLYNTDFPAGIAARLARVPGRFCTVHGHIFRGTGRPGLKGVRNSLFSLVYRAVYCLFDRVIVVCHALKQDLAKRPGIKVREDKIRVIYNGIDFEEITGRAGVTDNAIKDILDNKDLRYVGVIGNFDRIKGHHILIKAIPEVIKRVGDVKFLFAGEGEEKKRLMRLAKKYKVGNNIVFLGTVRDIGKLISACELIAMPSLSEGMPLTAMESMFLGKPVVATRVGGAPELIRDNENGILVPPDNCGELSKAIIKMLSDKTLAHRMGQKGREMINSRYGVKFQAREMTRETERLYAGYA